DRETGPDGASGTPGRPGTLVSSGSERDDRPDDLAGLQVGDGVVDVLEADLAGDHPLEVEATGPPQPQHPREVAAHVGRAVVRALDRLLVEEQLERVELEGLVHRPGAHDAGHAAAAGGV